MLNLQQIFHIDFNYLMLRHDKIYPLLRSVAEMGYNCILWEVEDKIRWETCPECVHPDAFSKEEFKDILNYARSLGLEAIPLLQTLGHAEYVLKNQEYQHLREMPEWEDCYCVSKPQVTELLQKWIAEYLSLFGEIRDFHFGGDEAYWFGKCPVCADKIRQKGTLGLAMEHLQYLSDPLLKAGIRPNIWFDMVIQHQDETETLLPVLKNFRLWDWHYNRSFQEPYTETLDILQHKFGLDVIPCSAARAWGDRVGCPAPHRAENSAVTAREAVLRNLSGYCTTSWSIRLGNYELQKHILAIAPLAAKSPNSNFKELLQTSIIEQYACNPEQAELFVKAADLCAVKYPYAMAHELGIGWCQCKMHKKIRHNWLKESLIKKREEIEYQNYNFDQARQDLKKALQIFQEDLSSFSRSWQEAAEVQLAFLELAQKIFTKDADGLAYTQKLHQKMESLFKTWQTDLSAKTAAKRLPSTVFTIRR